MHGNEVKINKIEDQATFVLPKLKSAQLALCSLLQPIKRRALCVCTCVCVCVSVCVRVYVCVCV
jgi:hypothetical protein